MLVAAGANEARRGVREGVGPILVTRIAVDAPEIAILWKRLDGASCVVTRKDTALVVALLLFGNLQKEQAVESPREAIDVAKRWQEEP